jgi:hypothetical protein
MKLTDDQLAETMGFDNPRRSDAEMLDRVWAELNRAKEAAERTIQEGNEAREET